MSDVDSTSWIFYRDRPEWKDVTPVPQDDEDIPVVKIAYSEKFTDVFNYLRGVMKVDERSERAFVLTKDAVLLNAANYTVWHYRRALISALNKSWQDELRFVTELIEEHPKNYQVWHHRRCIVQKLSEQNKADVAVELEFTKRIFEDDAKNYHAWEYRQFVLTHFKAFNEELQFTESLIDDDVFNNSAWNQRFFVLTHMHFRPSTESLRDAAAKSDNGAEWDAAVKQLRAIVAREIEFTTARIERAPENESAWSYLRGVVETCCRLINASANKSAPAQHSTLHICDFDELLTMANSVIERHAGLETSLASRASLALEFAFDFLAAKREKELSGDGANEKAEQTAGKMRDYVAKLCELDPIRTEYWQYLRRANQL